MSTVAPFGFRSPFCIRNLIVDPDAVIVTDVSAYTSPGGVETFDASHFVDGEFIASYESQPSQTLPAWASALGGRWWISGPRTTYDGSSYNDVTGATVSSDYGDFGFSFSDGTGFVVPTLLTLQEVSKLMWLLESLRAELPSYSLATEYDGMGGYLYDDSDPVDITATSRVRVDGILSGPAPPRKRVCGSSSITSDSYFETSVYQDTGDDTYISVYAFSNLIITPNVYRVFSLAGDLLGYFADFKTLWYCYMATSASGDDTAKNFVYNAIYSAFAPWFYDDYSQPDPTEPPNLPIPTPTAYCEYLSLGGINLPVYKWQAPYGANVGGAFPTLTATFYTVVP